MALSIGRICPLEMLRNIMLMIKLLLLVLLNKTILLMNLLGSKSLEQLANREYKFV